MKKEMIMSYGQASLYTVPYMGIRKAVKTLEFINKSHNLNGPG